MDSNRVKRFVCARSAGFCTEQDRQESERESKRGRRWFSPKGIDWDRGLPTHTGDAVGELRGGADHAEPGADVSAVVELAQGRDLAGSAHHSATVRGRGERAR